MSINKELYYIQACYAMEQDSYLPYNHTDAEDIFEEGLINLHTDNNPEKIFIKQEFYEKLSSETKDVLNIIYNSPEDIKKFSKKLFWKLAAPLIVNKKIKQRITKELKNYCSLL